MRMFGLIVVVLLIIWGYNHAQEKKRREQEQQQENAAAAAFFGGVINAAVNGQNQEPIAREMRKPDNGYRSVLNQPEGMSGVPSSVTIGPNGERYYQYDRLPAAPVR
jgi:hypothetical protein